MSGRSLKKRVLNSRLLMWPIVIVTTLLLRISYFANRKTYDFSADSAAYISGEKPCIMCFWHGRMIAQFFINPSRTVYVLSTRHTDGVAVSMLSQSFGVRTVWGTRSKGAQAAARAARGLLEVVLQGHNVAITPDGPRGPAQQAAPGATYLASKSGHPLLPVTFSATRSKRFRSWDRFMLFLPFGRIHYSVPSPIFVPPDADDATLAHYTQQLQDTLDRITAEADATCRVVA